MKVVVVKKNKESNERMVSRFTKLVNSSRKLMTIRDRRYFKKEAPQGKVRAAAIAREKYRAVRNKQRFH